MPRRYGGSDKPENLVHLCGSCHNAIESLYDDGFYERLARAFEQRDWDVDDELSGERVSIEEAIDREVAVDQFEHIFEDDDGRLHCGYCPTVFESYNHAGIARHIRFKHGFDPYPGSGLPTEENFDYSGEEWYK